MRGLFSGVPPGVEWDFILHDGASDPPKPSGIARTFPGGWAAHQEDPGGGILDFGLDGGVPQDLGTLTHVER